MSDQKQLRLMPIPGLEGRYSVTTCGQFYSHLRNKFMVLNASNGGYLFAGLTNKARYRKPYYIHRVVASVFIPNPHNKATINHKDGVKANNNVSNLEWATQSENNYHAKTLYPEIQKGTNNNQAKLTEPQVLEIYHRSKKGEGRRALGREFGVTEFAIYSIATGRRWAYLTGEQLERIDL